MNYYFGLFQYAEVEIDRTKKIPHDETRISKFIHLVSCCIFLYSSTRQAADSIEFFEISWS